MDASDRFLSLLEPELPRAGNPYSLWHVKSHTKKCRKLIFTRTNDVTPNTCSEHLFLMTYNGMLFYGLEALIYESPEHSTLFISKADTSGYLEESAGHLNIGAVTSALLRGVLRYYVPTHKRVRLCLFAKSQGQYLFLGSKENPAKHVLEDGQLVRWWLRVLDGLADEFGQIIKSGLVIPGCNPRDTCRYFPESSRMNWFVGDIFGEGDSVSDRTLAIRRIPRFPDDPKTRFLESLVSTRRAKRVSRTQFWEEMPSRQEFLLCKSVGIIGLEGILDAQRHQSLEGAHSVGQRDYKAIVDLLLSLDFSSRHAARHATEEVAKRIPDFAIMTIAGRKAMHSHPEYKVTRSSEDPEVSRKREVNVLGAGLVRRKKNKTK